MVREASLKVSERPHLENQEAVVGLLWEHLKDADREKVVLLLLDAQNRITGLVDLFAGTVDQCHVYPREILKAAITANAVGIILAHNHPSGAVRPSREDEALTETVEKACRLVGIKLLDHVIVGEEGHFSFRQAGILDRP